VRTAGAEAAQAVEAQVKQQQVLEQEFKQQQDRADGLARELAFVRAELDTARAAGLEAARAAESAKIEQTQASASERSKTETLGRELASARKAIEERSALLAAAHAEVLRVTETNSAVAAEQKLALDKEHERAEALARELASVRKEPDAPRAQTSREPAVDSPHERVADSATRMTVGKGRSSAPVSGDAVASNLERSSASESSRPEAQSAAREAASDLDPKVLMRTERSTSGSAGSHSPVDEQRLLARANALLGQADISGARPLLEYALEHGSARAAFMLAETYDPRVLQSWRARGIAGDLTKARKLYERAQAGGIEDAKERIKALR
jgi:hypothetical protein